MILLISYSKFYCGWSIQNMRANDFEPWWVYLFLKNHFLCSEWGARLQAERSPPERCVFNGVQQFLRHSGDNLYTSMHLAARSKIRSARIASIFRLCSAQLFCLYIRRLPPVQNSLFSASEYKKADIDFFQISRRMSDANLEDFSESGTRASFLLGHDDGGCRPDLDDVRAFTRLQSLFTEHVIIFTYSRHLLIRLFALINCNSPGLGFFPWRGRRRVPPRGFGRIDHRSASEV